MTTHTATSPHRTIDVEVIGTMVYASNGALLGDLHGMTILGWDFAKRDAAEVYAEETAKIRAAQRSEELLEQTRRHLTGMLSA